MSKNFKIRVRVFQTSDPTPVQTPATIYATEIQQCLHLSNNIYKDRLDSYYGRK